MTTAINTAEEARSLTDRIIFNLEDAHKLMGDAFEMRAWERLDYASWAAYFSAEFGNIMSDLKLTGERRAEVVTQLRSKGMTNADIGKAVGASTNTVRNDLRRVNVKTDIDSVVASNGRTRPATYAPRVEPAATRPALSVVREAPPKGPGRGRMRPHFVMERHIKDGFRLAVVLEDYWRENAESIQEVPDELIESFVEDLWDSRTAIKQLLDVIEEKTGKTSKKRKRNKE